MHTTAGKVQWLPKERECHTPLNDDGQLRIYEEMLAEVYCRWLVVWLPHEDRGTLDMLVMTQQAGLERCSTAHGTLCHTHHQQNYRRRVLALASCCFAHH